MKQYEDPILGKILINQLTDRFEIPMEVLYNINVGFFQTKYSGCPHLMEHLICRYYEVNGIEDNSTNASTNEG